MKVIITGSTGMVGEGVLFECLQNPQVAEVLIINRKHYELQHPKLKELIVADFFNLANFTENIKGYDACFYCAGISSVGMKEKQYRHITYDTTLAFARVLSQANSNMLFTYVSGAHTDSSETSRLMWARVKGKTENDLMKLSFKDQYNFRPGVMLPFDGQKNWKAVYKWLTKIIRFFSPKNVITMHELGLAMINTVTRGFDKKVLEIADIKVLAKL
ncbi:MAG: NAD-dependent epimerase/dehydratase family protein [Sphingobacteriales bacterium]|nr:MAG: NAD-dependent epimerase/dehydratase family protein [Sphingobacteriales bacterium]